MIQAIVGVIVGSIVKTLTGGILKSIHDAIWWEGAIKGGLFVGISLIALYLLLRRDGK